MAEIEHEWSAYSSAVYQISNDLDTLINQVAENVGVEKNDLSNLVFESTRLSHVFNSLNRYSIRVYFTILSRVLKAITKASTEDHREIILESLLSMDKIIKEAARSKYEPLSAILVNIKLISVITKSKISPAVFLPNSISQQFKYTEIDYKDKYPISKKEAINKLSSIDLNSLSKFTKHLEELFSLFGAVKLETNNNSMANALWASQILISQILNGSIEGNDLQIACIHQILECVKEDPEISPKNSIIKILTSEILWNGIATDQLTRFANAFDISSVIDQRVKEVEILHEPPIMCLLNGPVKDQVALNIDRLEYWTNRSLDEDITSRINELIKQIINACLFSNVPIAKMPKVIEKPTSKEIPVLIEDIKCWFSMVENGWESYYASVKDPINYNSQDRLRTICLSSINFFKNEIYKGKRAEYKRIAAALKKSSRAMIFYSSNLSQNLLDAALLCNDIELTSLAEKESELYSYLTAIEKSLNDCPLNRSKIQCINIDHESEYISEDIKFTDEIAFNTIVKKVIARFKNPNEKSLHSIGHTLKIFLDFAHKSYQPLILDALEECDRLVKHLQESPGDSVVIPENIQELYKQYKISKLEAPYKIDNQNQKAQVIKFDLPKMNQPENIPDELWGIFLDERSSRIAALENSIPANDFEVVLRNVHSLHGIHKQLGFKQQQKLFREIEIELNNDKVLSKNLTDKINEAIKAKSNEIVDKQESNKRGTKNSDDIQVEIGTKSTATNECKEFINPNEKNLLVNQSSIVSECEDNLEMIPLFITEAEEIYEGLKSQKTMGYKDRAYLLRALHTLKGSSAMVGLKTLSALVHEVEQSLIDCNNPTPVIIDQTLQNVYRSIDILVDYFAQEPVTISKSILHTLQFNDSIESQLEFESIEFNKKSNIDNLLSSEASNHSPKSSITLSVDIITDLVRKLSNIENELYQLSQPVNLITERSLDQMAITDRQINNTTSLNREFNDAAHQDLVASEKELIIKALNDDALLNQTLIQSQFENCRTAMSAIEKLTGSTRESKIDLQSVLDIQSNEITDRLKSLVSRCNSDLNLNVKLEIQSPELSISKSIGRDFQVIAEHIVRNSFSHAFKDIDREPKIKFSIKKMGAGLHVSISDNGNGIDTAKLIKKAIKSGLIENEEIEIDNAVNLIFEPGLSASDTADNMSGRGVGMDVVFDIVSRRNGTINVTNNPGTGLGFDITLPDTTRSIRAVVLSGQEYSISIPLTSISNTEELSSKPSRSIKRYNKVYRVINLNHITPEDNNGSLSIVYLKEQMDGVNIAILCRSSIKMKNLTPMESPVKIRGIVGYANIIGNGLSVIIDPIQILNKRIELLSDSYRVIGSKKPISIIKKVLVIDDSQIVRIKIGKIYQQYGFTIDFAENGQDALKMIKKKKYDLISSDAEMPFVSGFDFVRSYHEIMKEKSAPVIMVTSRTSDRHKALSEKIGVDVFVSKHEAEKGIKEALEHMKMAS